MSRARLAVITLALSASAIAVACGNFSGSDTPTTDTGDSGLDATMAVDAMPDATPGSSDAGSDAGLHFCARQDAAAFCEDFDNPSLLFGALTSYILMDASLAPTTECVSPPTALVAGSVPYYAEGGAPLNEAVVGIESAVVGGGRRVELDVRIPDPGSGGVLIQILGNDGDGGYTGAGYVVRKPDGQIYAASFLPTGVAAGASPIVSSVTGAPWMHLTIDVQPQGGGAAFSVTVFIDPSTVMQQAPVVIPGTFSSIQLEFGSQASVDSGPFRVEIDNIVVR